MGKLVVKVVLVLGIALGAANYLLYIKTGNSFFANRSLDFSLSMPDLPELAAPKLPSMDGEPAEVYKWTDDNGQVHFSSQPPEGVPAERLAFDPQANRMQALPSEQPPEGASERPSVSLPDGNVYDPDAVRQLIDDAKAVQQTLNQRYENMNQN